MSFLKNKVAAAYEDSTGLSAKVYYDFMNHLSDMAINLHSPYKVKKHGGWQNRVSYTKNP